MQMLLGLLGQGLLGSGHAGADDMAVVDLPGNELRYPSDRMVIPQPEEGPITQEGDLFPPSTQGGDTAPKFRRISDVSPEEIQRRKQVMGSFADEPLANPAPQQPQGIPRDERLQMLIEAIRKNVSLSNAGQSSDTIRRLYELIGGGR